MHGGHVISHVNVFVDFDFKAAVGEDGKVIVDVNDIDVHNDIREFP